MIVSCGEALIDFVPVSTAAGEPAYLPRPGGSPFNVAITVGRLGVPAGFLGGVSTDFFGDQLVGALRASDVDTRHVARVVNPTALAFVDLAADEPHYTFYDREAAHRVWEPADLDPSVSALHFGSIALIDGPAANGFAELMARERGRSLLAIDPNIRPALVRDREAEYRERLGAMLRLAGLIKVSIADLAWLEPQSDPAAVASSWLGGDAELVVVTAGAAGSTAFTRGRPPVHCPARQIQLVDTVGAGDSFMGALLAGLERSGIASPAGLGTLDDAAIMELLVFASDVSSITCSRPGADPPRRDEVPLSGRRAGRKEVR